MAARRAGRRTQGRPGAAAVTDTLHLRLGALCIIAVALVYFGGWRPLGVLAGAMLFSLVNALQFQVQIGNLNIPYDVLVMLPYILTILALALTRRTQAPAALSRPFERGEN